MLCPLTPGEDCVKADCAWWEDDLTLCAMKEIALELRYTQLRLADLIQKLPQPRQPRR